jgi:hypothetical protein
LQIDDNFKKLIKELGNAINESLGDSKTIAGVMEQIRTAGYDLFLVFEVTIGFNKRGQEGAIDVQKLASDSPHGTEFRLTSQDTQFLRSLKIRIEEDRK